MDRRELLRTLGSASALALVPREARAAWERVAAGVRPAAGLSTAQLATVEAIADSIIPRTDTPGASDVNVAGFIDVIVSENYDDEERERFTTGLASIDAALQFSGGSTFVALAPDARGAAIERFEALSDKRAEPARTYWRLKSLIVHGYFTSERVMKDVLRVQVMPGAFDGAAPHVRG